VILRPGAAAVQRVIFAGTYYSLSRERL